ncbi:MAG: AI-2E family transporter [Stellaceae bacterium]
MEGKDVRTAPQDNPRSDVKGHGGGPTPRRSQVSGWALFAVFVIIAILLYEIRYALVPFVFAVAIAFVVDPAIKGLERLLRSPRWVAATLLYLALLALAAAAGYWVAHSAGPDLMHVAARAPAILRHFLTEILGKKGLAIAGHTYTPDQIIKQMGAVMAGMLGTGALTRILGMVASVIFGGTLLIVLMIYFMISGPQLAAGTIWLLPPERRHSVEVLLPTLVPALRRYLVGILLVVIYATSAGWIGFGAIFRLPHAILLALTFGLLELVPVIGPVASLSIVGIVAVQQTSFLGTIFLMTFAVALRLSIDNLAGPLLLGHTARVHPVVIIIGFVVGAMLFGIVGLLLAVPTAVVIKTALQHYYAEPIRDRTRD